MTLNDVAGKIDPRYGTGTMKVWYMKPGVSRDLGMGLEWLVKKNMVPTHATFTQTHTFLGTLDTADVNEALEMMQGENWSPRGEARAFIKGLGLDHTTICTGDIVQVGDDVFFLDRLGFEKLPA